jgi:signal transduction histidine kinase
VAEQPDAPSIEEEFSRETARIIRARLPQGALLLLVVFALAAVLELAAHPSRTVPYAVVFALEVLACAIAIGLTRLAPQRSLGIATGVSIVLAALVTLYHVTVRGEAEILVLALGYLIVGTMVLFPWGWRGQLPVAAASVVAFLVAVAAGVSHATPLSLNALGLISIGGMTVGNALFLERHRFAFFRQAADLRRANSSLAEANRAQTQFLANVSHELRTPLNAMLGYLDLLPEGTFGAFPRDCQEPLGRVAANARMLLRLTNDFLDLARLEAKRLSLQIETVPLVPVCGEAIELVSPGMRGKALDLISDVPDSLTVRADRDRLRQVLVNLLSNAIKFTESGTVNLRAHRNGDSTVSIDIADTGVGIAASEREAIFEPFRRGSRGTAAGGVGIGLALSRQLTEAMGGEMMVESVAGRGSTFSVRLPAAGTVQS